MLPGGAGAREHGLPQLQPSPVQHHGIRPGYHGELSSHLLQTFVYLFAPICQNIRETDFDQNMRLINGRKIWSAMWEYRHPDVETFTAQVRGDHNNKGSSRRKDTLLLSTFLYCKVKPKQTIVKDLRKKISKNTGDDTGIFMGECKYNL